MTLRLHRRLWPQLQAEPALLRLYRELELPLAAVLGEMERAGVALDVPALAAQTAELDAAQEELRARIFAACGREFNLNAPARPAAGAVRGARPRAAAQDADRRRLHRRGRARGAGQAGRAAAHDPGAPPARQAAVHLPAQAGRRCCTPTPAACTPPSTRRAPPPGGCPPPTPTCRTSPSARRRAGACGAPSSPRPRPRAGGRRLLADRAAHHGPHLRRPGAVRRVRGRRRRATAPPPPRCSGSRRRRSTPASAAPPRAINFGLMYGMSPFGLARQLGLRPARGRGLRRRLLRALPEGAGVHGPHPRTRRAGAASWRPSGAGGCICRTSARATATAASTPSARRSTRPCKGTAADIIKRAMIDLARRAGGALAGLPAAAAGARRAGAGGVGRTGRRGRRGDARADGGGGRAAGAAGGRRRRRAELGGGARLAALRLAPGLGADALHVGVREAEVVADLVQQHLAHQVGEAAAVLPPTAPASGSR